MVELGDGIDLAVNERVRAIERLLVARPIDGITETVPSFRSLLVYYEPRRIGYRRLIASLASLVAEAATSATPRERVIELPCCYDDPALGFELDAAARRLGMTATALAARHAAAEYRVYFLGFAPGQPYMTAIDDPIDIPRLAVPRTVTPAGSVAIGGTQCSIYSVDSPGGFWVLGHTPVRLYDPDAAQPVLLCAGDRVRMRRIGRDEHDRIAAQVEARTYCAVRS